MDKAQVFGSTLIVGLIGGLVYASYCANTKLEREKRELMFKTIPIVHQVDSTYNSRRDSLDKAYHLQRDSLKKIYSNYLDDMLRGK